MNNLDTREWLITNGLGSFASGTVCDARTRTYHGWLIAAVDPPTQRTLLLSHLDASLEVAGQVWQLSTNFWKNGAINPCGYQLLRSFTTEPIPTWIWGEGEWQLQRQLIMPYGLDITNIDSWSDQKNLPDYRFLIPDSRLPIPNYQFPIPNSRSPIPDAQFSNSILIQYHYQGNQSAILKLRPLISDRNFHHQQFVNSGLKFSQLVDKNRIGLQAMSSEEIGTPWQLRWSHGEYEQGANWYNNYYYPEEEKRGLGDREDLYNPGCIKIMLAPQQRITLEAKIGWSAAAIPDLKNEEFDQAIQAEKHRIQVIYPAINTGESSTIWQKLLKAADQFIVYRKRITEPTVIAGYHWFNDWGRDTLIALPGLALTTGRFDLAKGLLETFGKYCKDGLIPNTFPDAGSQPIYNSIDASLLWIETLGLYLEATQDWNFLARQYPVVREIYKQFTTGTLYNIHVDKMDGLLMWDAEGVALTWMDAVIEGETITPRRGKPIEINALWYSALCWADQWAKKLIEIGVEDSINLIYHRKNYEQQAELVAASLQKFWNPSLGYFYDLISPEDQPDPSIRPNAVLALSFYHCGFPEQQAQSVLKIASERLLTPFGLRSLDPADPQYIGKYAGNRFHRDRAYHQGTVWTWLIGAFIRAWIRFYPSLEVPFNSQPLLEHFEQQACLGSVSEIFDGDAPHIPQGAIAQAWSVAEMMRIYPHLSVNSKQ